MFDLEYVGIFVHLSVCSKLGAWTLSLLSLLHTKVALPLSALFFCLPLPLLEQQAVGQISTKFEKQTNTINPERIDMIECTNSVFILLHCDQVEQSNESAS